MQTRDTVIEAVVEICRTDAPAPWPVASDANAIYIKLHSGIADEEIGSVLHTAFSYNRIAVSAEPEETLNSFLAGDGFVLPGGLRLSEGGREVLPGCCSGLESWREWLAVPHGNNTVWAGHDPSPEVEYVEGKVRVWQDVKRDGVKYVEFELEEMAVLLRRVESDLAGFLYRLGKWTEYVAPGLGQRLVSYFAENMHI